ncbi:MAG: ribosome silencing factor, partial [Acidobacteriota bacterium]|nr:ribosome silencing factor [Acidobacteriota bacterium]
HRIDGVPDALGQGGRVFLLPIEPAEVASREIRLRCQRGHDIDALVPPAVARYISEQMLYSEKPSSTGDLPAELTECIAAARERQAGELLILDLRGLSDVTDYFVICHGSSDRQVKAIAETIEDRLRTNLSVKPKHVEGRLQAEWILMDYIDIVVHVFHEEKRRFYRIERLWGDAPSVELPPDPLDPSRATPPA